MYNILWIINLSELQNNSSCDPRGYLERYDYSVSYATRDNFEECLRGDLSQYNCIIFASNCLRDSEIFQKLSSEEYKNKLRKYIENNGSCIVLHQNMDDGCKIDLFNIEALLFTIEVKRSNVNEEIESAFQLFDRYVLFPHEIDLKKISREMQRNIYYDGLYWRNFKVNSLGWNSITVSNEQKPLIRVSTEYNVIITELVLDFQQQYELLDNLIINLINKKNVGFVSNSSLHSFATASMMDGLENRNVYVSRYDAKNKSDFELLIKRIQNGIHKIIIIDIDGRYEGQIKEIKSVCVKYKAKCIIPGRCIKIYDYSNYYLRKYNEIEFRIIAELGRGLIENSCARTINILKVLKGCDYSLGRYNAHILQCVEENIQKNYCKDGSYNNSFGGTCQMVWYLRNFAPQDGRLKEAQGWLRKKVSKWTDEINIREKLDYYEAIQEKSDDIKAAVEEYLNHPSEAAYDLLACFHAAIEIKDRTLMKRVMEHIMVLNAFSIDESIKIAWGLIQLLKEERSNTEYTQLLNKLMKDIRSWDMIPREQFLLKNLEVSYLFYEYSQLNEYSDTQISSIVEASIVGIDEKAAIHAIEQLQEVNYEQKQENDNLKNSIVEYQRMINERDMAIHRNKNERRFLWCLVGALLILVFVTWILSDWIIQEHSLDDWVSYIVKGLKDNLFIETPISVAFIYCIKKANENKENNELIGGE